MSRTLTLTSPMMRGADVERAQLILRAKGYFVGQIDGVFGEITGRACMAAKNELGYATKNIKPSYGPELEGFLTGHKKRTPAMVVRANQRKKKQSLGVRALRIAREYIGTKESPAGSNRVMFSDWYGMVGPWCAMFVTYCFVRAGSKAFARGERWAYCPYLLSAARRNEGVTLISRANVRPGDVVLFSWKQDGVANHVGIVAGKIDAAGNFHTVEGNTAVGNDSNGGEVMARVRNISQVIGFVRAVR